MKFVVHVADSTRLDSAVAAGWYEERKPGLGDDFRTEVQAAIKALANDALLHGLRFRDVRRAGLRRFPDYGLFYIIREAEVTIFAIVHGARNPAWLRRRRSHLG